MAYALAFGGLAATVWSAVARAEHSVAIGVVLHAAGGVGLISTYQTGLVLAGVVVLGKLVDAVSPSLEEQPDDFGLGGGASEPITAAVGGS